MIDKSPAQRSISD